MSNISAATKISYPKALYNLIVQYSNDPFEQRIMIKDELDSSSKNTSGKKSPINATIPKHRPSSKEQSKFVSPRARSQAKKT